MRAADLLNEFEDMNPEQLAQSGKHGLFNVAASAFADCAESFEAERGFVARVETMIDLAPHSSSDGGET